jgi:RNA polymerase sigma-70 factor (ECF subfamily)
MGELRAWLRRILECRLANSRRHFLEAEKRAAAREVPLAALPAGSRRDTGGPVCPSPSPSGHALRNELSQAMERALDRLPEHYRHAVVWRHQDRLSFEQIGQRMGCSPEAARKLWYRALGQLRRELGPLA